ncbi:hypothetical protein [Legionella clemsonensis]|uniref:Alpha/beta hydrolase family protein n=1 Tax=Legionella clemsonensis TaxID=1867846 RepID=A0A222P1A7_9GAMM|nr:hypothetical protein [Legionella clemsonensis]ASQ45616.1 hypothetical protein clem_05300 [Legionella clemsonensis]
MKEGEFYAGGLELHFFHNPEFENIDAIEEDSDKAAAIARNALRILMMGWRDNWHEILSFKVFKAVLIRRDRELMRGMRLAFQQGFNFIYEQLQAKNALSIEQHRQAELYISNCLTLLPFSDINPYESIAIPQWVKNEWRLVDYKVVPVELTPTHGLKKLFIRDEDRVFAYALEPITDENAEPHLVFMGTTYPAGQGFSEQVNTDLKGFDTVGNQLYRSGRNRLLTWLSTQSKKVRVCGTSLGGSLSLLLAIDQGDKLSSVYPLNPAGLYDSWFKSHFDRWDQFINKPHVLIQKQGNDPVSRFGIWKSDWDVVHVTPPPDKQGPNEFVDHALNYAGFAETKFIGVDTEQDNEEHRQRNFWLYTLGRGIVYYLALLPYRYLVRPSIYYAATHKTQFLLLSASILLLTLSAILWPSVILSSAFVLTFIGLPFLMHAAFKLGKMIATVFSNEKIPPAACHDPALPRNPLLDIYNNQIEEAFSVKELGTYYHAKRVLVKNKPFIPESEKEGEKDKLGGFFKKELLGKSLEKNSEQTLITVRNTKAKIYDMRQTIRLMSQIGFHSKEALIVILKENHENYINGKRGSPSCQR